MRTYTLAAGCARITVVEVTRGEVLLVVRFPDGTEVTCDPPEPAYAGTPAGD
jgi:hypothetical protein